MLAPQSGRAAFDPSPLPLLDGILALAALITTTVVLIAQNRQTRIEQQHMHISLQVLTAIEEVGLTQDPGESDVSPAAGSLAGADPKVS